MNNVLICSLRGFNGSQTSVKFCFLFLKRTPGRACLQNVSESTDLL